MNTGQGWLMWFLRGVSFLCLLILFARLGELQIIKGTYFRSIAEGNRINRIVIPAPRGKILARGGEVLVSSTNERRDYPLGEKFAHVGGYVGIVNENEVGKIDPACPEKGIKVSETLVGRTGLEVQYDCTLRGVDGEELVEVDSMGRKLRTLGIRNPKVGTDLTTTIDFNLQQVSFDAFDKNLEGAIVVTDTNGQVLALHSFPSFNPSDVALSVSDKRLPLFNRSIAGAYHPGSVFKPVIAIAALEEGKIDENFRYTDTGSIAVNTYLYNNWYFTQYGRTEGEIGLVKALARSTDTFFYKVGEFLGAEKISNWARKFGYGVITGIDIPGEVSGLVPDPAWKKSVKGEGWFLGNTYHFAIGQGDLASSPLQVATSIVAIARDGSACPPHLTGNVKCKDLDISKENIAIVKKGMQGACAPGGTGYVFFDFVPIVACKTGTAETGTGDLTHAWFTVFAPSDKPEIVATVLVENGGEGSKAAAPVAKKIFEYWFGKK